MSDSLSNFFSHLKNAQNNRILVIEHPKSKIIMSILEILQECGYIRGYRLNYSNLSFLEKGFICKEQKQKRPTKLQQNNDHLREQNQIGEGLLLRRRKTTPIPGSEGESNYKIEILLKYKNQKPAINQIVRISKPSKRIYSSAGKLSSFSKKEMQKFQRVLPQSNENLSPLKFMKGVLILSTSKGIMSDLTANRLNIGGEILCHIS